MNHIEASERFEQSHFRKIDKLFWIAGAMDSYDLNSYLSEIDDRDMKRILPDIYSDSRYRDAQESESLLDLFNGHNKLGLIAEVHIPTASNFSFKNGRPSSWRTNNGICRIEHVYAETLDGLLSEIEKLCQSVFNEQVAKWKKNNPAPLTKNAKIKK